MKTKTPKLWLRNTSRYPDAECFILCRVARESVERSLAADQVLPPSIVKLTNTYHGYCGRAAWTEWEHRRGKDSIKWKRILVRVGPPDRFPRRVCYLKFKDMPEYEFKTYREAIVGVAAHEWGHVLGASGRKAGEEMCEMMLQDAVDLYRKHQAEIDAEIHQALAVRKVLEDSRAKARANAKNPALLRQRRMEAALEKFNQWQRRARAAQKKLKFYARRVKYYRRLLEPAEPVSLAAEPNNSVDSTKSVSDTIRV